MSFWVVAYFVGGAMSAFLFAWLDNRGTVPSNPAKALFYTVIWPATYVLLMAAGFWEAWIAFYEWVGRRATQEDETP